MTKGKNTLPIKVHYFLFFASLAPVLPYMMVVGLQLGVPVSVQGAVTALTLLIVVVFKPLIAAAADSYPTLRKHIFICLIVLMTVFYSAIYFVDPFTGPPKFPVDVKLLSERELHELYGPDLTLPFSCSLENTSVSMPTTELSSHVFYLQVNGTKQGDGSSCDVMTCCSDSCSTSTSAACYQLNLAQPLDERYDASVAGQRGGEVLISATDNLCLYCAGITGNAFSCSSNALPVDQMQSSLQRTADCIAADEEHSIFTEPNFYIFVFLMLMAMLMFSTANSVTDAICLDCVGSSGDYGSQRAWGSVGWALFGLLTGILVDWWSTDDVIKNYAPAFLLTLVIGLSDAAVSTYSLQVPKLSQETSLWRDLKPLLRSPVFLVFLFFTVMSGCFDGIVATYVFVLQEEMAAGTPAVHHLKLLQGLTIVAQSGTEVPFMFYCDRLTKRYSPENITTMVYGLYGIRFLLLGILGVTGNVWLTLLVELLNGPCFGLGYTAIVVFAGHISPPGTSATVQSVTNICYESIGYSIACLLGGVMIQWLGGAANYLVFSAIAMVICVMHWVTFNKLMLHPNVESLAVQSDTTKQLKLEDNKEVEVLTPLSTTDTKVNDDHGSDRHDNRVY